MPRHSFAENALPLPQICLGTMTFGAQTPEDDAHSQLDYALEHRVNFIDTAEMYAVPPSAQSYGVTETIIGRWLVKKPRERIILATKAAGPGRALTWIRNGPKGDRADLMAAVDASLKRLQTDYIDLYQLHWPARNQPMFGQWQYDPQAEREAPDIRHQLDALAELMRQGKVRAIGVSNEHAWGLMRFVRLSEEFGLPRIVTTQNAYNLLNRTYEYGLAEISQREHIGLLAYSPLAFGLLTGKYLTGGSGRMTLFAGFGQRYCQNRPGVTPAVTAYCQLARSVGLTPTQLALGFVRSRFFVASTILGASCLSQLKENLTACSTQLSAEVLQAIDVIHLTHGNPAP